MSTTRTCRNCGAEVPSENQFCTVCGTQMEFRPPDTQAPYASGGPIQHQHGGPSPYPPAGPTPYPPVAAAATQPMPAQPMGSPLPTSHPTPNPYQTPGVATQGFQAPVAPMTSTHGRRQVSGIGETPAQTGDLGGVALAHGEVVKRVYQLGRLERALGWVQGTLIVTDARVLYQAEASNKLSRSTLNQEIPLADVKGLGLVARTGMSAAGFGAWLLGSFIGLVVASILGPMIATFFALMSGSFGRNASTGWTVFLLVVVVALSITTFVLRRRASFIELAVFSADIDTSPIRVSGAIGTSGGRGFIALFALPLIMLLELMGLVDAGAAADNADVDSIRAMYAELGAVILDLQSRGTLGAD